MISDVIRLLPDSVANQIAAGEVIQRPASVVKELVENAIDAGATAVTIIIQDAGRTLIQVVDNGCGMSPTDARMAFERHATSKITQAADLFSLHTMGFRGEALPSIAAVAQVELRTMRADDSIGTRLEIADSQFVRQEPAACVVGTNIKVKNLFFHMPARRKFLKKDPQELSHILHEFERLALVNPGVDFTLVNNDNTMRQLFGGSLRKRIIDLFGKTVDGRIVPVETETGIVSISGFVGLPQNAVRKGAKQFLFVNGRNMRHPYFHKAVMSCYADLIASDAQPSYFINFEVDPATIDVNIHPQKHEIKFENEQEIWQILVAAIREALGKVNAVTGIDFDQNDAPDIPPLDPNNGMPVQPVDFDLDYNPFKEDSGTMSQPSRQGSIRQASHWSERRSSALSDWDKLYAGFDRRAAADNAAPDNTPAETHADADPVQQSIEIGAAIDSTNIIQLRNRYIITPSAEGLMVIDRYRAHLRVLFDSYEAASESGRDFVSQQLLFPETVCLSPSEQVIIDSMAPELEAAGFDLSYLGDNTWAVNGLPSAISSVDPREVIAAIVDASEQGGNDADPSKMMRRRINLAMARARAIRQGTTMTDADAENLVASLFHCVTPNFTPDGRPVFTVISNNSIDDLLG